MPHTFYLRLTVPWFCCRYSYLIQVDAINGARINVSAVASYSGSVITMKKDGALLSSGGVQWKFIDLAGGSQSTIKIEVLNQDSGVTLDYELIVVRPLPDCTTTQLSQW